MKMNNKTYDILKYIAQIVLPALATLYAALVPLWHLPYGEPIVGTIVAVDAFLGALLMISSKKYYESDEDVDGYIDFDNDEEEMTIDLSDVDFEKFGDGERVRLKVRAGSIAVEPSEEEYQGKH